MNILVFGTGGGAAEVESLCSVFGHTIVAFLDNDSTKWNTMRSGKPIFPPAAAKELEYDRIVTASEVFHAEMRQQLLELGIPDERIFALDSDSDYWAGGEPLLIFRRHVVDEATSKLHAEVERFEIGAVADEDFPPPVSWETHELLVERLWGALLAAERDAPEAAEPYQVGRNWGKFLASTRPEYLGVRKNGDLKALGKLLANFFRNEMSTGILGGRIAFESFSQPGIKRVIRQNFNIWAYSLGEAPLQEVGLPPIGNPYGFWIEGVIVHPNTFLNHYRGRFVQKLLGSIDRPVIAEIGGGFGGFGFYVLKFIPGCCYLNFDLPENLLISAYFLSLSYPGLRIHLYSGRENLQALMNEFDLILLPQFVLPMLPDRSVDLMFNTISLSEMNYTTICEYLEQIGRVTDGYFYHENLIVNNMGYLFYPIDTFPKPPDFQELSRQPSRWPVFSAQSKEHTHMEQLFIRRDRCLVGSRGAVLRP